MSGLPKPENTEEPKVKTTSQNLNYDAEINDISALKQQLTQPRESYQDKATTETIDGEQYDPSMEEEQNMLDDPALLQEASEGWVETIDFGVQMGCGMYAQNMEESEKYGASKEQKRQLVEAWKPYVREKGLEIPPWLRLAINNLMYYGPKVQMAYNDRRFKVIEKKQEELERMQQEMQRNMANKDAEPQRKNPTAEEPNETVKNKEEQE